MTKSLVIVESPAKAKTINKYLGKDFKVMASMGHVRDLPKKNLGVSIEDNFEPQYITLPNKKNVVSDLKSEAKKADQVFLAPDPDREGEAICWHLQEAVIPKGKPVHRVLFNEITKKAVTAAIQKPLQVNMNLVDAQQARRILDRLVGYQISPILWQKVKGGISAGRVQSVALRMIVDRENEIRAFVSEEYWSFLAQLEGKLPPPFKARLVKWQDEAIRLGNKTAKRSIDNEELARTVEAALKQATFTIQDIKKKAKSQSAPPPFTTSKLQQEASRVLGFTVSRTMTLAQKLYEGIEIDGEPIGLITYMRTDSTRVSEEALAQVREYIGKNFAEPYLPEKARYFKQNKGAQDGHEAIRPSRVDLRPEDVAPYLDRSELRLYTLIWKRFVASQMEAKKMNETVLEIAADQGILEAKGLVTTFDGYSTLYTADKPVQDSESEEPTGELPNLSVGEQLHLLELKTEQNFTKPPARYNEASLVKALEENGIGRPSTYATIISTIQNRTYVEKQEGRFHPSDLGVLVTTLLVDAFPELMDIHYTAKMEDYLDQVERGEITWKGLLKDFYRGFENNLKQAEAEMPNMKRQGLVTDLPCEVCGSPTAIKNGKYGQFLSCTNYPECTFAKRIRDIDPETTQMSVLKSMINKEEPQIVEGMNCPECGGNLVKKRSKYGEFLACSNFPTCKYIHQEKVEVPCPKCQGEIRVRKSKRGKVFYGCSNYPKCDFVSWDKPSGKPCPQCHEPTTFYKERKQGTTQYCQKQDCNYSEQLSEVGVSD
ncbi:MAG: type I DNA topoisomerase [Acidobacteria bacterium]|nr:type I DNA topoisomerase [Acidobacteriota bacterium]MCB9396644.1 type I DNA topoisomerase [Acidobacteriota bacterium]